MIVVCNSSPLIALSQIHQLSLLQHLFQQVYIPETVFQETVLQTRIGLQRENILRAIAENFIVVAQPHSNYPFKRTIDEGERGVLNLAFDNHADFLIMDDKKARNEAKELGFKVLRTYTLLKRAEQLKLIDSHATLLQALADLKIYLPK